MFRAFLALTALWCLVACDGPSAAKRAEFPPDDRVRADARDWLAKHYALNLPEGAGDVRLSCTVMGSQCDLVVRIDPSESGLDTHFLMWGYYDREGDQFLLSRFDDDLQSRLVQANVLSWFKERIEKPDAPKVAIRVYEHNDFVGISDRLPRNIVELKQLDAETLVKRYGDSIGLHLYVYVLDEPEHYAPRARAALERLLAEPLIRQLGHGLEVGWYFRRETLRPGEDARELIRNADNLKFPSTNKENTRALWHIDINGKKFTNDLDAPIEELWPRLEQKEPYLVG